MENNTKQKIKNFIITNKLMCILLLSSVFIFISTLCYPFIYVAAAVLVVGMCFLDFNDIFCAFLYTCIFGCFLVPFIASIIAGFVVVVVRYIIDVKKKKAEFLAMPFWVTTAICVLFSCIHYEVDDLGFFQGIMMIAFLYFIYFVVVYRKQISIKKLFNYLFLALIVSIAMSSLLYIIPTAKTLSFDNGNYVYTLMKDKVAFNDGQYNRLVLTAFHVNHLAAFCLFAMAFSSIVLLTKKNKTKKEIIYYSLMYLVNLAVGFLTLSKAFMVVFAFEVGIVLLYYAVKHKKKAFKLIGIVAGLLILFCLIFRQRLDTILERFFVYNYDTILGMLTTGRSAIWQKYTNAVLETPAKLLFGFGLFSQDQLLIGPHNFYIFLLYRFGIIGIFLLGLLVYCYIKTIKDKPNFSIRLSLIFFTFLVIGLQEACMDERFFFLVIGIMLMFVGDKGTKIKDLKQEQADKEKVVQEQK